MRLIDADALIAEYDRVHVGSPGGARKLMEDAPTIELLAQPEHRWVQVEETLPEDGHEVWVTIKGHDVIYCREGETIEDAVERISRERWVTRAYWSKEENGWNDPTFGCPLIVSPIAWMEIDKPEPYKENVDGN